MSAAAASRRHRLPQRLSWSLIPPPLDLSFDSQASLPAIIVTPSSPTGNRDFKVAFLADNEPKPEVQNPVSAHSQHEQQIPGSLPAYAASPPGTPSKQYRRRSFGFLWGFGDLQLKPRTYLLLFVPIVILVFHLLAHQMVQHRPHLRFDFDDASHIAHVHGPPPHAHGGMGMRVEALKVSDPPPPSPPPSHRNWFGLGTTQEARHPRNFVIVEERRNPSSHAEDSL